MGKKSLPTSSSLTLSTIMNTIINTLIPIESIHAHGVDEKEHMKDQTVCVGQTRYSATHRYGESGGEDVAFL